MDKILYDSAQDIHDSFYKREIGQTQTQFSACIDKLIYQHLTPEEEENIKVMQEYRATMVEELYD